MIENLLIIIPNDLRVILHLLVGVLRCSFRLLKHRIVFQMSSCLQIPLFIAAGGQAKMMSPSCGRCTLRDEYNYQNSEDESKHFLVLCWVISNTKW